MEIAVNADTLSKSQVLTKKAAKVATYYHPRTWKEKGVWWTGGLFLVTYLIVVFILGIYWSRSPGVYDVREQALSLVNQDENQLVTGTATTATAIRIGETLLDKPGGYLTNDISPPGLYLDNMPNWEFGALTAWRDLLNALRNDFSRAQSQSVEEKDLAIAQPQSNYQSDSWILPSTESEYRKGIAALYRYNQGLSDTAVTHSQFYARADNLTTYLEVVEKRLGSFAQRLSYAVGQASLDTALAGDPSARQSKPVPTQTRTKTPWTKIDDIFFEARGYTWALLHVLQAIQIDFAPVLKDKNAVVSVEQITRELKNTQNTIWSPLILNGTGYGPMANHSLVSASYISRVNAAITDLRSLLQQG
ncbi:hypothetical protein EDC29_10964 [Marichromatium gracile]|uniref:DUF2333 family protein n=1 Tax=Marichromatium gracile TaxID=1048 RepID=A0A4R4A7Q0_MARGR|nr:DUF2333 family protein [Marichromatium gracile]MBK1709111.1 hypothetical protein [Marichromatium gracile]RNE90064.1 DUF2333 family protein [Marichromatium sp. AB31]TCW34704.1 hypothetical protein EDC29_10964 [Marichromatium gracile]